MGADLKVVWEGDFSGGFRVFKAHSLPSIVAEFVTEGTAWPGRIVLRVRARAVGGTLEPAYTTNGVSASTGGRVIVVQVAPGTRTC